jgi:hypothetical protein
MSAAYIAGVTENQAEANITFDRTQVTSRPELRGSRYLWLKNDASLSAKQTAEHDSLVKANLRTLKAITISSPANSTLKQRPAHCLEWSAAIVASGNSIQTVTAVDFGTSQRLKQILDQRPCALRQQAAAPGPRKHCLFVPGQCE